MIILHDLGDLVGNISSIMTKHMIMQLKLHRFVYLIIQIILGY